MLVVVEVVLVDVGVVLVFGVAFVVVVVVVFGVGVVVGLVSVELIMVSWYCAPPSPRTTALTSHW
jgi:hypothetical protein